MPHTANIIVQRDNGTAHMGSLAYLTDSDTNSAARFGMTERFVLVALRCHFSGSSGQADMAINLDSGMGPRYDANLWILDGPSGTGVGTGKDVNFRIPPDELMHWIFDGAAGDMIVPTWTNPDPDNMAWGLEVFLAPADAI